MTEAVDWDAVYLSNHASRLTRSTAWFESANELIAAAEAIAPSVTAYWDSIAKWQKDKSQIFNEHSGHHAFLMLYAFACENYCKGYLAQRLSLEERNKLVTAGVFPKSLHTHNLLRLASDVGFANKGLEDEELLRRLTHASIWAGRYPLSVQYDAATTEVFSDGRTYSLSYYAANDVERARSMAGRLRDFVGARASYRVSRDVNGR
jgi:hypothetical protein